MKIFSSKDRAARPRAASLWSYAGLIGLAGVAALVLLAALIYAAILPAAREALDNQARETHGHTYTAIFDARLMELRRWLAAAAAAPVVHDALAGGNPETIRQAGPLLNAVLDFADRVEVYPLGSAVLDLEAEVPISYAALDVIKRAEAGQLTGPEAIGGKHRAIYVAQPVEIDGTVAGVVLAVIAPRFFRDPLAGFDATEGRLTLEQAFDGTSGMGVLGWGDATAVGPAQRFELAAPHWSLVYEPATRTPADVIAPDTVRNTLIAALVIFVAGVLATFVRLAANLRHDRGLLRDRLLGRTADAESAGAFRLTALAEIARDLSSGFTAAAPVVAETATGATPEAGLEQPAVAEPIAPLASGPAAEAANAATGGPQPAALGGALSNQGATGDRTVRVDPEIFRAYDIRGITTENLTDDVVYLIGRAFAAEALDCDQRRVAVGRDGRLSSASLSSALVRGLTEGGVNVVDIGEVPTPLLYFATHVLETGTGIMITGSHNPPEYNGLKMVLAGDTLAEARIQSLRQRIEQNQLSEGVGQIEIVDLREAYLERVLSDVVVAQRLRVVVDCGNGIAGSIAPELIRRLDCEVIPLYCDVDGSFPNHHPDPADPRNLEDLVTVVKAESADLGIAFDGDGDRIGVVTASGMIIWPDKLMMLFAQDIVGRNPGADIIYDVKCSRHLNTVVSELGGRPIMWKTGHSNIKAKLRETGALLAGEFSGHICFGERWYGFDDALYAAARLLEIVGAAHESADALFGQFPKSFSTPELTIRTTERAKFEIMARLTAEADFGAWALTTIDGIRVDYPDGWGLIRPSNTSPMLTLRFEADDLQALARIQDIFAAQLSRIDPELKFR